MTEDETAAAPAGSHTLADLYERWTLDQVPAIGVSCGTAFEAHPQKFKDVPRNVADALAALKYRTGNDEFFLSDDQRKATINPILGSSDGTPDTPGEDGFHSAASAVRQSASAFVERSFDTGEEQLRDAFRDSAETLRAYMTTVDGAVVESALARVDNQFSAVVGVLRSKEFASGLGLRPAPSGGTWPLGLEVSGDGASLVQVIAGQMNPPTTISGDRFLAVQRIAHFGARTMDAVATHRFDADKKKSDEIIGTAYRWSTALRDLGAAQQPQRPL